MPASNLETNMVSGIYRKICFNLPEVTLKACDKATPPLDQLNRDEKKDLYGSITKSNYGFRTPKM